MASLSPNLLVQPAAMEVAVAGSSEAVGRAVTALNSEGFSAISWTPDSTSGLSIVPGFSQLDRILEAAASGPPVLMIAPPDNLQNSRVAYDAFDSVGEAFDSEDLIRRAYALLARRGYLHRLVTRFDPQATLLTLNSDAEWVRCRTCIVGLIRLERPESGDRLPALLVSRAAAAHSLLDELSADVLVSDDLWNVILLISLPWKKLDAAADSDVMTVLTETEHDLTGSRKVCLWQRISPLSHISGFVAAESPWIPSSSNPLREELHALAGDAAEFEALVSIFKRRLVEADVENIIDVLRRRSSE